MGGELGHIVAEFGEKATDALTKNMGKVAETLDKNLGGKLGPAYVQASKNSYSELSNSVKDHMAKFISLDAHLADTNSVSLAKGRDLKARIERNLDRNLSLIAQDNKAKGTSMPMHEMRSLALHGDPNLPKVKGVGRGVMLSSGRFITSARDSVAGPNDHNLVGLGAAIANEHSPMRARVIMDAFSNYLHEEQFSMGNAHGTRLVSNLKAAKKFPINPLDEEGAKVSDIDWKPSRYQTPTPLERSLTRGAAPVLTPKSGLRHLTTPLNVMLRASLKAMGGAIDASWGSGYKNARAQLEFYGTVGEALARENDQLYRFQNGLINKFLPNTVGEFIHRNIGIPGFDFIRGRSLVAAGYQGRLIAEEQAANLFSNDPMLEHRAMMELKYLGIDGAKIKARGGHTFSDKFGPSLLTFDELGQAMFENANQRVYIETSGARSQMATSSFAGRMFFMYHNYITMQSRMLMRNFYRHYEKRDPIGLTKDLVILGTLFPTAGFATNALAQIWMGKDPKSIKQDLEAFTDPKDFWSKAEAFSHTAGFGVVTDYLHATSRFKLANAIIGPVFNTGVEHVEDVYKAGAGIASGREKRKGPYQVHTYAPLARDVLHDIPSLGIGAMLANHAFPTQQQLTAEKPMTAKTLAAKRAAATRKLKRGY